MRPIPLQEAAINLNLRHEMITGEDQHIRVKTLDDYYDKIKIGNYSDYKFKENKDELVKWLRIHCTEVKALFKKARISEGRELSIRP